MKYNLIKCYERFGVILSSDKRLFPERWIQTLVLLSVEHILGTTSGLVLR